MSVSIKVNSIIGLPVITVVDGKNVQTVKEIIYDGQDNQVKAIVVDEKGWFHNAKIILINDIQSIGKDAILIHDQSVIVDADNQRDSVISSIVNDDNFLTKNEVITESGKKLGRVTDIYFNFPGGDVDAIEVSEGFIKNIGSGAKKVKIIDVITIGQNNLIVKDYAEEEFEEQGKNQGLNKVVAETKENVYNIAETTTVKAQETFDAAKSTTSDLAHKVGDKTQEIVNSDPVQNAMEKTKEVAGNVKDTVTEKYDQAKDNVESGKLQNNLQSTFEKVKEKAGGAVEVVKQKTTEVVDTTKEKAASTNEGVQTSITEKRIHDAIGKNVGDILLLSKSDDIMASKGDFVTHELVEQARREGNLDKLLDNIE
jgi:uncharacterized protein YrrD